MQESDSTIVHFSRRFDEACEKRGIKNATLAKAVGCTPTAIGNYRKDRIPKAEELSRIATFLGTSMEWLLTGRSGTQKTKSMPRKPVGMCQPYAEVCPHCTDCTKCGHCAKSGGKCSVCF